MYYLGIVWVLEFGLMVGNILIIPDRIEIPAPSHLLGK